MDNKITPDGPLKPMEMVFINADDFAIAKIIKEVLSEPKECPVTDIEIEKASLEFTGAKLTSGTFNGFFEGFKFAEWMHRSSLVRADIPLYIKCRMYIHQMQRRNMGLRQKQSPQNQQQ